MPTQGAFAQLRERLANPRVVVCREQIMEGRPEAASLLALAEQAEALGYDSVWAGDSSLACSRHEPLALLAIRPRELESFGRGGIDIFGQA